ncbi:MAG: rhombosortase [Chromatiales bacterium]|nr:rhombosortase [Chromatiales bacterium]
MTAIPFLSPLRTSASLPWAFLLALGLAVLQLLPAEAHDWLRYERPAVAAGQWWRLVTGNLIHLGWAHYLLNTGALLVGAWLFAAERPPLQWLVALLCCGLAVNLGLFWFNPEIYWCVGLSGVLHGFLLIGAWDWARRGDPVGWGLLFLWCGKVIWEQSSGAMPMSEEIVGGAVITAAHLWGLLGGLAYVLGEAGWRRWRRQV